MPPKFKPMPGKPLSMRLAETISTLIGLEPLVQLANAALPQPNLDPRKTALTQRIAQSPLNNPPGGVLAEFRPLLDPLDASGVQTYTVGKVAQKVREMRDPSLRGTPLERAERAYGAGIEARIARNMKNQTGRKFK